MVGATLFKSHICEEIEHLYKKAAHLDLLEKALKVATSLNYSYNR